MAAIPPHDPAGTSSIACLRKRPRGHYTRAIYLALSTTTRRRSRPSHHFFIGDAKGIDASALAYLLAQEDDYPDVQQRITVHLSRPGQLAKYQAMGVRTVCATERYDKSNPRARHLNRDAEMTQASDYDILWARTEIEEKVFYGQKWRPRVSATELNRLRRLEREKRADEEGVEGRC